MLGGGGECSNLRYIIISPDGIVIVTWIFCYLSEVVVPKHLNYLIVL